MPNRTVDDEGITSCCGVPTTFLDDGTGAWVEVCRGCKEEVHHAL